MDLQFFKGKKVLVTGHTGFKGTWLCTILLQAGAEVSGCSHTDFAFFNDCGLDKQMASHIADIRDYDTLQRIVKQTAPDIVLHLAAQPIVRTSYDDPRYTYETNVMGTVNILEAVRHCETVGSLLNVTTDKVYENKEWHWGYRENDRLSGYDPYSNSKSCSELVTYSFYNSFFAKSGTKIGTARAGNVIGGGDFAKDRIIPDCIRAAQNKQDIIVRNKSSIRPWQHVLEPLSGYLTFAKALYEGNLSGESFNFGPKDEDCVDVGRLTDSFCTAWGEGLTWLYQPVANATHEATFLKLDCSKAGNVLGWKPQWNVDTAIAKTVQWHKAVQSGESALSITKKQVGEYFNV